MIWNVRKKLFSGKDLEQITTAYGEKFDMLNLQFISRSKRYFSMAPADIYALLIPMNYKLKKEEITALVEASTREEAQQIFRKTYYAKSMIIFLPTISKNSIIICSVPLWKRHPARIPIPWQCFIPTCTTRSTK